MLFHFSYYSSILNHFNIKKSFLCLPYIYDAIIHRPSFDHVHISLYNQTILHTVPSKAEPQKKCFCSDYFCMNNDSEYTLRYPSKQKGVKELVLWVKVTMSSLSNGISWLKNTVDRTVLDTPLE